MYFIRLKLFAYCADLYYNSSVKLCGVLFAIRFCLSLSGKKRFFKSRNTAYSRKNTDIKKATLKRIRETGRRFARVRARCLHIQKNDILKGEQ
jgi:hypothetical protein